MTISHFSSLFVFATIVSVVFGLTNKTQLREQLRYGIVVFLSFLGVAFFVSWIMFPFPF